MALNAPIAEAIARGDSRSLKKLGLTRKNVNLIVSFFSSSQLCEGESLQVLAVSETPFVPYITNPTCLIYAILCEQIDTVLHLILKVHAKLDVKIVFPQFSTSF
jgi:hypothetical protein